MSSNSRDNRALVGAALIAAPVLAGIAYAAAASLGSVGPGASGVEPGRLVRVLGERATWNGLGFTLWISGVATALATAAAVTVAVTFRRSTRFDGAMRAIAAVPLAVPHIVAGALGVWILAQSGMIARFLVGVGLIAAPSQMPALVYDPLGLGLAFTMAWKEFAFLLVVTAALLTTQETDLEEAARTLGAGPWATFRRVTLPVLWRGLLPAVIAVFVFVAGSYEAAALLAPSDPVVLPLLVSERAADPDLARRGDAYVISLLLLALGAIAVVVHEWARAGWEPLGE
ncbi:MAG: ABC transporter permease subunit [Gemmatimonadaceae bacterium]